MKHLIGCIGAMMMSSSLANAQDIAAGAELYLQHCATCHGIELDGKGPMAPALLLQPPNLKDLSANNDGTFPTVRVVMRIDGRDPLVSHGSPMPVYGPYFDGDDVPLKAETGQPIMTSSPVADLVSYLRALQE